MVDEVSWPLQPGGKLIDCLCCIQRSQQTDLKTVQSPEVRSEASRDISHAEHEFTVLKDPQVYTPDYQIYLQSPQAQRVQ